MAAEVQRFPLTWPIGWKRTASAARRRAAFYSTRQVTNSLGTFKAKESISVGTALKRLTDELRRLSAKSIVISSNLRVREDGLPHAQQAKQLEDPGVAVYFKLNQIDRVLACDRWSSAADNLAAIAGHIAAIRTQDRYGVGTVDQAFAGYKALPAKGSTWRSSLGFAPDELVDRDMVERAFKTRARSAHPDVSGGSHDAMASLTVARDEALQELQVAQ